MILIKPIKGPTRGFIVLLTKYIFTLLNSVDNWDLPKVRPTHPFLLYLTEGTPYTMTWGTTRVGVPDELTDPPLSS